ncbi:RNA recognition motif. (a.k.a. RRM, RBD, or RNP domain), partial [Haematococcus lacustris]
MSKGYAFVTMSSPEEMLAAITGANGYKIEGRAMVVKKAGEKSSAPIHSMLGIGHPGLGHPGQ